MGLRDKVGGWFDRATASIANSIVERSKGGLFLPPGMIRGRHFGGFHKLDKWIKDAIRASCTVVRSAGVGGVSVGPDELTESVCWVVWKETGCEVTFLKFNDFLNTVNTMEAADGKGFTDRFKLDIRKTDSSRAYGSILVVALKPDEVKEFHKGHDDQRGFAGYVGAWVPSSVDEAETIQPPSYLGG